MPAIRLRADPAVAIVEAAAPRLAALLLGSQELLEINRLHPRPDATRAAEIRNARLGADARAREEQGPSAAAEQLTQCCDFAWIWSRHILPASYYPRSTIRYPLPSS